MFSCCIIWANHVLIIIIYKCFIYTILETVECFCGGWLLVFDPWLHHLLAVWPRTSSSINVNIYGTCTVSGTMIKILYGLFYWILNGIDIIIISILVKSRNISNFPKIIHPAVSTSTKQGTLITYRSKSIDMITWDKTCKVYLGNWYIGSVQ